MSKPEDDPYGTLPPPSAKPAPAARGADDDAYRTVAPPSARPAPAARGGDDDAYRTEPPPAPVDPFAQPGPAHSNAADPNVTLPPPSVSQRPTVPPRSVTPPPTPRPAAATNRAAPTVAPAGRTLSSMQTGIVAAPQPPAPGASFRADALLRCAIGEWVPERLLGEGAWGAVFLARHARDDRRAALKVPKLGDSSEAAHVLTRFREEVKTLQKVHAAGHSPHVVGLLGADAEARPYPWLALEFVEGTDLGAELKRRRKFPPRDALRLGLVILEGLGEAHRAGVVHRDLKPENVLMTLGGEIRIGDFGVARSVVRDKEDGIEVGVTMTGQHVGTPHFMSPEQIEGKADPRGDIYSFGAMLYDMLTGRPPFRGSKLAVVNAHITKNPAPPSDFVVGLPPKLDELVVQKLMAKEADERISIADAQAAIKECIRLLDEAPEKPKEERPVALELRNGDEVGDYTIDREIGRGGMGIVYAGRDASGEMYALKVAGFAFSTQEDARRQLMRDAENAIEVTKTQPHPAVAKVHRVVEDVVRGIPIVYLVSELVPGISLQDVLARNGPLEEKTVVQLWIQVAEGLASVHDAGVLHLDIAPGNILLAGVDKDEENPDVFLAKVKKATPKIVDFGISKRVGSQTMRGVEGNPGYMSPEQCDGLSPTFATDVYMFGATFYHLTTGRPLYSGEPLSVMNKQRVELPRFADLEDPALGYDLALVIHKCLSKAPEHRYKTCAELLDDLRALGKPAFPRAQLKASWEREQRALETKTGVPKKLIGAIVVFFLLCLGGVAVWAKGQSQRAETAALEREVETLTDDRLLAFHREVKGKGDPASVRGALDVRAKKLVDEALGEVADAARTIAKSPDVAREQLSALGKKKVAPLLEAARAEADWFKALGDGAERLGRADAKDLPAYAVLCRLAGSVRDESWDDAAKVAGEVPGELSPDGVKVRDELLAKRDGALAALAAALGKAEAEVQRLVDAPKKLKDFDAADKAVRDFAVEHPRHKTHQETARKLAALEARIREERAKNPEALEADRALRELEGKLAQVKFDEMLEPTYEPRDAKRDTLTSGIRDLDSWLSGHPEFQATRAGDDVRAKLQKALDAFTRWARHAWDRTEADAKVEWAREDSPEKFDKLAAVYRAFDAAWEKAANRDIKLDAERTLADARRAALERVRVALAAAIDRPAAEAEKALRAHDLAAAAAQAKKARVFERAEQWSALAERIRLVERQVELFRDLDAAAVTVPIEGGKRLVVDACETTVESYAVFLKWVKANDAEARALVPEGETPPAFIPPDWEAQSKSPRRAVVNVSGVEAAVFARWAGRRLPSADEWLVLARGPGAGDEERMGAWLDGAKGRGWPGRAPFEAGQSGEKNAFGVLDTSGNVSEWTATENPQSKGRYYYCGPNFDTPRNVESYDLRRKNYRPRTERLPTLGLRCVREDTK